MMQCTSLLFFTIPQFKKNNHTWTRLTFELVFWDQLYTNVFYFNFDYSNDATMITYIESYKPLKSDYDLESDPELQMTVL